MPINAGKLKPKGTHFLQFEGHCFKEIEVTLKGMKVEVKLNNPKFVFCTELFLVANTVVQKFEWY